jgi:hypothetical protein
MHTHLAMAFGIGDSDCDRYGHHCRGTRLIAKWTGWNDCDGVRKVDSDCHRYVLRSSQRRMGYPSSGLNGMIFMGLVLPCKCIHCTHLILFVPFDVSKWEHFVSREPFPLSAQRVAAKSPTHRRRSLPGLISNLQPQTPQTPQT